MFRCLIVFFVLMSGSALAADWKFYGSARVSTFYTDFKQDPFRGGIDSKNYEQDLNGNARVGAKIKAGNRLSARIELGAKHGNANTRLIWGRWDFGAGSLNIGLDYSPLIFPYSNQVYNIYHKKSGDTNMSYFGMLYGGRKPMIRLEFGGFQIAAVKPTERVCLYSAVPLSQPETQTAWPSIQAKYTLGFDKGHMAVVGGYQVFDVKGSRGRYGVESLILGIGGRLNLGRAYLKGNFWGGRNVGNMADILVNGNLASTLEGQSSGDLDGDGIGLARYSDGSRGDPQGVTDRTALAGLVVAGYKIRKGLYLEAGYGSVGTRLDTSGQTRDHAHCYYLQSTIFLAPGVFITPEIGRYDAREDGLAANYIGAKWQINF